MPPYSLIAAATTALFFVGIAVDAVLVKRHREPIAKWVYRRLRYLRYWWHLVRLTPFPSLAKRIASISLRGWESLTGKRIVSTRSVVVATIASFLLTSAAYSYATSFDPEYYWSMLFDSDNFLGSLRELAWILLILVALNLPLDLLTLAVTWKALRSVARARSKLAIATSCAVDIAVASVAMIAQLFAFSYLASLFSDYKSGPHINEGLWHVICESMAGVPNAITAIFTGEFRDPRYLTDLRLMTTFLSASILLPTLAYLTFGLLLVVSRLVLIITLDVASYLIERLTEEHNPLGMPVFAMTGALASAFSWLGVAFWELVGWLTFSPL